MNIEKGRRKWIRNIEGPPDYISRADILTGEGKDIIDWDSRFWTDRLLLIAYLEHEYQDKSIKPSNLPCIVFHADNSIYKRYSLNIELGDRVKDSRIVGLKNLRHRPRELIEEGLLLKGSPSHAKLTCIGLEISLYILARILERKGITGETIRALEKGEFNESFEKYQILEEMELLHTENMNVIISKILHELIEFIGKKGNFFIFPDYYSNAKYILNKRSMLHTFRVLREGPSIVRNPDLLNDESISMEDVEWIFKLELIKNKRSIQLCTTIEELDFPLILKAPSGYGKTTWILQEAFELGREGLNDIFPVYVQLSRLAIVDDIVTYWDGTTSFEVTRLDSSQNGVQEFMINLLQSVLCPDLSEEMVRVATDDSSKKPLILLDGWNELDTALQQYIHEIIPSLLAKDWCILISTTWDDEYLNSITKERYNLSVFSLDDAIDMLVGLGVEKEHAEEQVQLAQKQYNLPLNPQMIRLLATFPKLSAPENPIELYQLWIKHRILSKNFNHLLRNVTHVEDIDQLLGKHFTRPTDKKRFRLSTYLIGPLLATTHDDDTQDYSIISFLGKTALCSLTTGLHNLSYEIAVDSNPFLKFFIEPRPKRGFGHYPVLNDPHLLLYFAAQEAVNLYKRNRLPNTEIRAFNYLLKEIKLILEFEGLPTSDKELGSKLAAIKVLFSMAEKIDPNYFPAGGFDETKGISYSLGYSIPPYFNGIMKFIKSIWSDVKQKPVTTQREILESVYDILENRPTQVILGITSPDGDSDIETRVNHEADYYFPLIFRILSIDYEKSKLRDLSRNEKIQFIWEQQQEDLVEWLLLISPRQLDDSIFEISKHIKNPYAFKQIFEFLLYDKESSNYRNWVNSLCKRCSESHTSELLTLCISHIIDEREPFVDDDTFNFVLEIIPQLDVDEAQQLLKNLSSHVLAQFQLESISEDLLNQNPILIDYWSGEVTKQQKLNGNKPSFTSEGFYEEFRNFTTLQKASVQIESEYEFRNWGWEHYLESLQKECNIGNPILKKIVEEDMDLEEVLSIVKPLGDNLDLERIIVGIMGEDGFSSYEDDYKPEFHSSLKNIPRELEMRYRSYILPILLQQFGECKSSFREWEFDFGDIMNGQGLWIVKCINHAIIDALNEGYLTDVANILRSYIDSKLWKRLRWILSFFWMGCYYSDKNDSEFARYPSFIDHENTIWKILDKPERKWFKLLESQAQLHKWANQRKREIRKKYRQQKRVTNENS
ncbi:MAG: hypothetical protein ACFFEV_00280 [Candidatus Thorarchaeota archaeon]